MLVVSSAASNTSILTLAERRAAVGVSDVNRDEELVTLGARVDAAICSYCNVAAGGVAVPTLRAETLTETIRIPQVSADRPRSKLVLARRPIISITSVVEDGTTLAATGYEINSAHGILLRLDGDDNESLWYGAKIVVVYRAGWATVPDNLKLAAAKLCILFWAEGTRDPNLKRVETAGIGSREYWVSPASDPLIPDEVAQLLAPYRNIAVG